MNAVIGIQDKEQARQFLLQRGIEAFRKQAGYKPEDIYVEFTTPFYRYCEQRYEISEENVRNNHPLATLFFQQWCERYTGECPWDSVAKTELITGQFWERYDELMRLEGIGWPLLKPHE